MNKPYVGARLCQVDPDGSIELPPFLLQLASERSPNWLLFAGPDPDAPCLCLFDERALAERLEQAGGARRAQRNFGFFEPAPFFSSGRLQLPAIARAGGWLGADALLIGAGDRLEVWDPDIAATRGCGTVAALAQLHRRLSLPQEDDNDPLLPLSDAVIRPFPAPGRGPLRAARRRAAQHVGSPARAA
ncbi:MAG: hypothetical protein K2X73_10510 [Sphingomonas sp.]|jgi:MraZ protein|uniref:hypothetical protein n=1 Tax=Sphingomonas sp. TaxID=28214 RepID=UPI00260146B6|nr:hypothetical protein [Sphingomonas sp.]MBX9882391.1 hypothetical protein [Sphingomonas sp.]